jgi:DNA polymerase bacteriophage-type
MPVAMDLIASDYSAIEAVVSACLAGEQWRIEAFQRRDPIYLVGASKITGTSLDYYLEYFERHGEHHSDRQRIGKVSELACGFGGWIGSYIAFGSTEDDATIKAQILAWRAASPAIVEMWGGQWRGLPWDTSRYRELYGVEGTAIAAIQTPGQWRFYRGIGFIHWNSALRIRLLSGRDLIYRNARVATSWRRADELTILYDTWNSNPKYGALGWGPMETYGGRLFENIVQATAHDVQRYSIRRLRDAGYPIVLHVYDENVAEVPEGFGSVAEFERIMCEMPSWARLADGSPWPIHAVDGWRGKRYRKG